MFSRSEQRKEEDLEEGVAKNDSHDEKHVDVSWSPSVVDKFSPGSRFLKPTR
jgi:hypothetical protein